MANLADIISDYFPPASGVNVPLASAVWTDFDLHMDTDDLEENFFVEGPDTDQFVGEGLALLIEPDNVSQGDLDDFLMSPGYRGIVQGEYSFDVVSGVSTRLTFTPTRPLAPHTEYYVNISAPLDNDGNTVSGFISWGFTTGSGSIETLPSTISTSILASSPQAINFTTTAGPLTIVKTTPANHTIEQDTDLEEIVIEFNKEVDPDSVNNNAIEVVTSVATDHPSVNAQAVGNLFKLFELDGKYLKIKI